MKGYDSRYTIALEHCGQLTPQYVIRFCGDWIGSAPTKQEAEEFRDIHTKARMAAFP